MGSSSGEKVSPMNWITLLQACAPILVALVGIIPTIISNRKKTQADIETLQKTLNSHIKNDEDDQARNKRYRILRFYDEICEGRKHSESHFEDILDDISDYKRYCSAHPDFRNSRGEIAMNDIESTYRRIKNKGGFLKGGKTNVAN